MKRFAIAIAISIICLVSLFAGGQSEFRLYDIPRSVANNNFVMIDLLGDSSVTTSELTDDYSKPANNNLAITRIVDILYKNKLNNNGNSTGEDNKAIVTVSSGDSTGFYFVHEENPTEKIPFEIETYKLTGTINSDKKYDFSSAAKVSADSTTVNSYTITLDSVDSTYGSGNWGDQFLGWISGSTYAKNVLYYDICIKLNLAAGASYEPGYYTTKIILSSNEFQEVTKANNGNNGKLTPAGTNKIDNVELSVRAYYGVDPDSSGNNINYSFYVTPSSDTYEMDLDQVAKYDVANLFFTKVDTGTGSGPGSNSKNYKKYTVYVSPTNVYNASGSYQFVKIGSEKQERTYGNTVDYKLYLKKGDGTYQDLSAVTQSTYNNVTTTSGFTNMSASNTSDVIIGGAFRESSSVYVILPKYDLTTMGTNKGKTYREEWNLNCHLYVEPVKDTTPDSDGVVPSHQKGLYYSYLYFTVVTN